MAKTLADAIKQHPKLAEIFKLCEDLRFEGKYENALNFLRLKGDAKYKNMTEDTVLEGEELASLEEFLTEVVCQEVIFEVNESSNVIFLTENGELDLPRMQAYAYEMDMRLPENINEHIPDTGRNVTEASNIGEKESLSDFLKKLENLNENERNARIYGRIKNILDAYNEKNAAEMKAINEKIQEGKKLSPEEEKKNKESILANLLEEYTKARSDRIESRIDDKEAIKIACVLRNSEDENIREMANAFLGGGIFDRQDPDKLSEMERELIISQALKELYDLEKIEADVEKIYLERFKNEQVITLSKSDKQEIISDIKKNMDFLYDQRIRAERNRSGTLKENLERDILQIDLLNPENAVLLLKIYTNLEKDIFKKNSRQESAEFKDTLKDVLSNIIYSEQNKNIFGEFLKEEKGKKFIDESMVNDRIKGIRPKYIKLFDMMQTYVNQVNKTSLPIVHLKFEQLEEIMPNNENIKNTIEEFLRLSRENDDKKDPDEQKLKRRTLDSLKRKITRTSKTTLLSADGKFNLDEIERYYNTVLNVTETSEEIEVSNIIKGFVAVDVAKGKRQAEVPLKRKIAEENGNRNYESANQIYEETITKYSELHALKHVYVNFQRAKPVSRMIRSEELSYMKSLVYLYSSNDSQKREFAQAILKYNFPNIQTDENGKIPPEEINALYQTYEPTEKNVLQSIKDVYEYQRKSCIHRGKENFDIRELDFDFDLNTINNVLRNKKLPPTHFDRKFLTEELEIVNKIRNEVDLSDPTNIITLVRIADNIDMEIREGTASPEHILLKQTLDRFASSQDVRNFFAGHIREDRIQIQNAVRSEKINPEILKLLDFDGEIEIEESGPKRHEYDELIYTTNLISIALSYRGNEERFYGNLNTYGLTDIPACRVFKKDGNPEGEIDFERVNKFSEILYEYFNRPESYEEVSKKMATILCNEEFLENYAKNFDDFIQGTSELMRHTLDIKENDRLENDSSNAKEIEWKDYLKMRPSSPEEVKEGLRTDTREISGIRFESQKEEKEQEARPTTDEENEVLVTDSEFENTFTQGVTVIIQEGKTDKETRVFDDDSELSDDSLNGFPVAEFRIGLSEESERPISEKKVEGLMEAQSVQVVVTSPQPEKGAEPDVALNDTEDVPEIVSAEVPEEESSQDETLWGKIKKWAIETYDSIINRIRDVKLIGTHDNNNNNNNNNNREVAEATVEESAKPNGLDRYNYVVDENNLSQPIEKPKIQKEISDGRDGREE